MLSSESFFDDVIRLSIKYKPDTQIPGILNTYKWHIIILIRPPQKDLYYEYVIFSNTLNQARQYYRFVRTLIPECFHDIEIAEVTQMDIQFLTLKNIISKIFQQKIVSLEYVATKEVSFCREEFQNNN